MIEPLQLAPGIDVAELRRVIEDCKRAVEELCYLPPRYLWPTGQMPKPRLVVDNSKEPGHADT